MAEPRRRRSRNNQWVMIAAVIAVLAVAGYLVWSVVGKKSTGTTYVTQVVSRGTLTVAVAGNGNVVSRNSASVNPNVSGTVTQLDTALGQHVKKGQVLFVVDNPALDANVVSAKANYQQSQSSRLKAKQAETQADVSLETGVLQAKQAVQQSQSQVYSAQVAYFKLTVPGYPGYTAGASDEQINAAKSSLDAANTGLETDQENYEHACRLQREGHAAAEKAYAAAVTSQDAAHQNYKQSITTADQRTVTAPIDGYITTLSINNGDQLGGGSSTNSSSRSSSAGGSSSSGGSTSSSSSNSAPIVISDLSELQAQVTIAETDRPKVKVGQKVEVTFDAVPNLSVTGHVSEIDAVGTSSSSVVTYGVTVVFDVQDKRLNPGMTASASIITQVETNVLLVPNAAIKTDTSGSTYVQTLPTSSGTGTTTDVTVTTGPAGDTQTEITSGLKGGENVVTQTISANSGSSTTGSRSGLSVLGGGRGAGGGGFGRGGQ